MIDVLSKCVGFQWDKGNSDKNWIKHNVTRSECEQIFFNLPLLTGNDEKHSDTEKRYYVLGQTDSGRRLFVVCTVRDQLIRVISARDMNKREREVYKR